MGGRRGIPLPKLDIAIPSTSPPNAGLKGMARLEETAAVVGGGRETPNVMVVVPKNGFGIKMSAKKGPGVMARDSQLEEVVEQDEADMEAEAESVAEEDRETPFWLSCLCGSPVLKGRIFSMTTLAVLLLVMTFVIYRYTSNYTKRSVGQVALPLRSQMLNRTIQRMSDFVIRNAAVTHTLKLRLEEGDIYHMDNSTRYPEGHMFVRQVVKAMFPSLAANPELQIIAFMMKDNRAVQLLRDTNVTYSIFCNSSRTSDIVWYLQPLDSRGEIMGPEFGVPGLDLRMKDGFDDWFRLGDRLVANMGLVTDVSPQLGTHCTVNSITGLHGALALTTNMDDIRKFMSSLDLLQGKMYFVQSSGYLVALSDATVTYTKEPSGISRMVHVTEVNNTLIAETAKYLEKEHTSASLYEQVTHASDVILMGKHHYVDSAPLIFADLSLSMVGAVIVPRSSIMGSVDRGTKGTLEFLVGLACGIFVVGCALILLATHYMTSEMRLKNELFTQLKAKERAEAVIEASRLFLANLSHDLRTPMAGIIGLLEILIANGLDVEQSGIVGNIMSTANTLHSLLNSILDISRVEMGQLSLDLVPFSLREALEVTVDLFSVETMNKGIEIVLDMPDELPDRLMGDPMRVRQVFSNLLSNCVKFTETGHVIIRGTLIRRVHRERSGQALRLRPSSPSTRKRSSSTSSSNQNSFSSKETTPRGSVHEGGSFSSKHKLAVLFEVSDTGKDVPVKQREAIFQNFVQLPDKHSRYGGTGFGLGIVRSLVQLMGGSISIVDNGVPGCTFSFSLVFSEVEPPTVSMEDTTTVEQVPLPLSLPLVNGAGVHALLAIPESIGKALVSKWLFHHGVTVWQVATLAETVSSTKNMWKQLASPCEVQQTPLPKTPWGALSRKKFSFRRNVDTEGGGPNRHVPAIPTAPADEADQSRPKGGIVLLDIHLVPEPVKAFFEEGGGFVPLLEALRKVKDEHSLNLPMVVVWLVVASTPADIQRTMKRAGCLVVQKPVYATRLASILCQVAPNPTLAVPPLRSNSILTAAKEPTPPHAPAPIEPSQLPVLVLERSLETAAEAKARPMSLEELRVEPLRNQIHLPHSTALVTEAPTQTQAQTSNGTAPAIEEQHPPDQRQTLEATAPKTELPEDQIQTLPAPPPKAKPQQDQVQPSPAVETNTERPQDGGQLPSVSAPKSEPTQAQAQPHSPPPVAVTAPTGATAEGKAGKASKGRAQEKATGEGTSKGVDSDCPLAGIRVLLVEDTPLMARVATLHLKKLGAVVTAVTDGQQAVDSLLPSYAPELLPAKPEAAKANRTGKSFIHSPSPAPKPTSPQTLSNGRPRPGSTLFDFVLMDCQMPVLDGYGATKEIRRMDQERLCHTPIIALTAHAMASDKQKCLDCGMDAYLTKPLQPAALVKTVQEIGLVNSP